MDDLTTDRNDAKYQLADDDGELLMDDDSSETATMLLDGLNK